MPETALIMDEEEEAEVLADTLELADILETGVNLADKLSEAALGRIGQRVIRDIDIDEKSREDWLKRYESALDIAMQVREKKNTPWPNASNIKYPLLTVAAVQFQARAYPAIVDGSNLVKGRVLGPDPDGQKRARADRIGQHMTWQLLFRMAGWEEDTDKLLLMLPIVGTVFRKSFYDSIENCNRSEMVSARDFIINYWAKSLETAPRFAHVLHYYPYEAKERIAAGLWRNVRIEGHDSPDADDQALVDFYEAHATIDLDDDGYPEPYVITCTKEGEIARIVPCFGVDEVIVRNTETGEAQKLAEFAERPDLIGDVVRITRRKYFSKYGFIPAPDGSFYDMGFGTLLEDLSATIDTVMNQMIDAGSLQNAQGGFLGDGVQIRGGNFTFKLGEWKRVNVTGGTLRDNVVPLNLPGPSAVLFNLLGMIIEAAKEITSVQDVMTGEGTANQPATTTLALIEQGQKVMSGIFKRIHRAFGEDLRILRRLNRDYLDDEEYFLLNDSEDAVQIGRADYADDDLDVMPVSDPNTVNDMQKMARAQALMAFNGDPLVNQEEIRRRYLESIGEKDIQTLLKMPEPQPDPKVILEGLKASLEKIKAENAGIQQRAAASKALAEAAEKLAALGLIPDAAALAGQASELGGDVENEAADDAGGTGRVPEMERQPADAGVPAIPDPLAAGDDGGVGAIEPADAMAAGTSEPVGPVGSDQL